MLSEFLIGLERVFNSSPLLGLGASFLAGVLVSFSPCIYPMIPITLGVVGVAALTSRLKGFLISFVFVLGAASLYTVLGAVASLTGVLLGAFFVNPLTYIILAVSFFLLGLSTLGVVALRLPFFPLNYAPKGKSFSIFTLGIVSGLAIIPCNFTVLGTILSLISLKKSIPYGIIALFLFSLGQGLIMLILGTFTSLIRKLPKSQTWLFAVNKGIGVVLVGISLYFFVKFLFIAKILI